MECTGALALSALQVLHAHIFITARTDYWLLQLSSC